MLWTLIVLLMLFWILGFAFHVAGGIIHVLLVIALVLFLVQLITVAGRSCSEGGRWPPSAITAIVCVDGCVRRADRARSVRAVLRAAVGSGRSSLNRPRQGCSGD
jgi:hypothetical protein